jgi:uncharacterized protein (TIGR02246 family)
MKLLVESILILVATSLVTLAQADVHSEIAKRTSSFEAAFNRGDAAAVAAHYLPDATVLAPGATRIDGRAEIQNLWQSYVEAGVKDLQLTTVDLENHGETANEIGTYSLSAPDGNGSRVQSSGKYVIIWKTDDIGVWHLYWDIWNDMP